MWWLSSYCMYSMYVHTYSSLLTNFFSLWPITETKGGGGKLRDKECSFPLVGWNTCDSESSFLLAGWKESTFLLVEPPFPRQAPFCWLTEKLLSVLSLTCILNILLPFCPVSPLSCLSYLSPFYNPTVSCTYLVSLGLSFPSESCISSVYPVLLNPGSCIMYIVYSFTQLFCPLASC